MTCYSMKSICRADVQLLLKDCMLNTLVVWSLGDSRYQQELLKDRDEPIRILKCSFQWGQSTCVTGLITEQCWCQHREGSALG